MARELGELDFVEYMLLYIAWLIISENDENAPTWLQFAKDTLEELGDLT